MEKRTVQNVKFETNDNPEELFVTDFGKKNEARLPNKISGAVFCNIDTSIFDTSGSLIFEVKVRGYSFCSGEDKPDNLYGCVLAFKRALDGVKYPTPETVAQYKKMKDALWKRTKPGSILRTHL